MIVFVSACGPVEFWIVFMLCRVSCFRFQIPPSVPVGKNYHTIIKDRVRSKCVNLCKSMHYFTIIVSFVSFMERERNAGSIYLCSMYAVLPLLMQCRVVIFDFCPLRTLLWSTQVRYSFWALKQYLVDAFHVPCHADLLVLSLDVPCHADLLVLSLSREPTSPPPKSKQPCSCSLSHHRLMLMKTIVKWVWKTSLKIPGQLGKKLDQRWGLKDIPRTEELWWLLSLPQ